MSLALLDLARANGPALIVAAPLIGAALAVALPNGRLSWLAAVVGALVAAVVGVDLALRAAGGGVNVATSLFGLRGDGFGAWAAALIASAGALSLLATGATLRREFGARGASFAMALGACVVAGWCGAALAGDVATLIIAAEGAWLASIGFVALGSEGARGALSGALRMLIHGGVAVALMLAGAGFVFAGAGTLDLFAIASAPIAAPTATAAGVALILFGLTLKAGVAPMHAWLGPVFGRAGGAAALLLAAVACAGALAAAGRVALFALSAPAIAPSLSLVLLTFGLMSVVIGSAQAIGAVHVRRMAAYACVAQAGCVLVSLSLGSPAGFAAALVLLSAYIAGALAVFGGAICLGDARGMSVLDGLGRRAFVSSVTLTAGALSLMGAPLTLGFLGRWRLIEAGVGGGWWWCAGAAIVASLAAVFYGGRIIERIYFRRAGALFEGGGWRSAFVAPVLAMAVAAIAVGLAPSSLLRAADAAVAATIEGAP